MINFRKAKFIKSCPNYLDAPKGNFPEVLICGKSNVGKSSVINRFLNRKNFARVGSAPGKTVHINYFLIDNFLCLYRGHREQIS